MNNGELYRTLTRALRKDADRVRDIAYGPRKRYGDTFAVSHEALAMQNFINGRGELARTEIEIELAQFAHDENL